MNHNKKDPYSVSPYALQFEGIYFHLFLVEFILESASFKISATVRYLVLATPKRNIGTNHNKKNPFSVSPGALTFVGM